MKILIDLTSLADNFSGIERYALNISKQMIIQDNLNEYILLFKNQIHKEFKEFENQDNLKIKIIKGNNKLIFNQIILPYTLYKIKADKYIFLAFPSPILFLKRGIVNTIHDLTCWDYPETMKFLSKWYFRISILNAIRISQNILTVSEFSKNRILDKFNVNKDINVIYNGVSEVFEKFEFNMGKNTEFKEKFNLPDSYIMSLGTLEPRKNIKLLIESFIELKEEGLLTEKLVLVGRNGWKINDILANYKKYAEDIIFTGFIEDEYLPYVYINSNLFVFPSLYEGFGIPLLEAMYMKTPTLVSNIEPFLEIFGNNTNNVFESNSKDDLKSKLINLKLSENTIYNNTIQALKFTWSREAKKLLKCLNIEESYE